jgi:hypothetical protein
MKKVTAVSILAVLLLAVFLPFSINVKIASAQDAGYSIQNVEHQVEVLYSGNIIIRDTITVTGQITGGFLIGFPYTYGSSVLKATAFSTERVFPMSLGVQLGDRSGFYGAEVTFPEGSPQVFTVVFVLASNLLTPKPNGFFLDFPAYPSFVKDATRCNVSLVLPPVAVVINITKTDGVVYTETFVKEGLTAFTYSPAIANFNVPEVWIKQIEFAELNRVVALGPSGEMSISDRYRIVNNSTDELAYLRLDLPANASNLVGKDEFGRVLDAEILIKSDSGSTVLHVNVTLTSTLRTGQSTHVTLEYHFPSAPSEQATRFALTFDIFPFSNYYVRAVTVAVILPEGAHVVSPQVSSVDPSLTVSRDLFQETLGISRQGMSHVDRDAPSIGVLRVVYDYSFLWVSLRPTLWVWGLVAIGSVVIAFWRRPKVSAPTGIVVPKLPTGLRPGNLRSFIEAYEERTRITSDLKALNARARKGKIQRRQYKVQRNALQARFDSLSLSIGELKATFRSAGGNLADLIRQLDASETDLNKTEANIRNVEVRYRTGEVPIEEYKKSLADLQRQKEKAETAINGTLLRLREEIR